MLLTCLWIQIYGSFHLTFIIYRPPAALWPGAKKDLYEHTASQPSLAGGVWAKLSARLLWSLNRANVSFPHLSGAVVKSSLSEQTSQAPLLGLWANCVAMDFLSFWWELSSFGRADRYVQTFRATEPTVFLLFFITNFRLDCQGRCDKKGTANLPGIFVGFLHGCFSQQSATEFCVQTEGWGHSKIT